MKRAPTKALPSAELLRLCLDYDPHTGELTWKARPLSTFGPSITPAFAAAWNRKFAGKPAFQRISRGYKSGKINGTLYYAHRIAWKYVHDTDPNNIDHRDGNTTHNWLDNLRAASPVINSQNRVITSRRSGGIAGVTQLRNGRWRAKLRVLGVNIVQKDFDERSAAVACRLDAEKSVGYYSRYRLNEASVTPA